MGHREPEEGQVSVPQYLLTYLALKCGFDHVLARMPILPEYQHHVFRVVPLCHSGKPARSQNKTESRADQQSIPLNSPAESAFVS